MALSSGQSFGQTLMALSRSRACQPSGQFAPYTGPCCVGDTGSTLEPLYRASDPSIRRMVNLIAGAGANSHMSSVGASRARSRGRMERLGGGRVWRRWHGDGVIELGAYTDPEVVAGQPSTCSAGERYETAWTRPTL